IQSIMGVKEKRTRRILPIIEGFKSIQGWLMDQEAAHLYHYARKLSQGTDNTIVEIGSWKGKSTMCLAKGLRNGFVFAIDPFNSAGEDGSKETYESHVGDENLMDTFLINMKNNDVEEKVKPLKGYSKDF